MEGLEEGDLLQHLLTCCSTCCCTIGRTPSQISIRAISLAHARASTHTRTPTPTHAHTRTIDAHPCPRDTQGTPKRHPKDTKRHPRDTRALPGFHVHEILPSVPQFDVHAPFRLRYLNNRVRVRPQVTQGARATEGAEERRQMELRNAAQS